MKIEKIKRGFMVDAIANGKGFEQNEPNEKGYVRPNALLVGFSPNYYPIKKEGIPDGTKIVNDYRVAIMNGVGSRLSNYQVFKDMQTLEKNISIDIVKIQRPIDEG